VSATADRLRIGEVSELVGITARTIRYYEELGLLGSDERSKGRHRVFTQADVARLKELVRFRDLLGLSLEELTTLADAEQLRAALRDRWEGELTDKERVAVLQQAEQIARQQLELVNAHRHKLDDFAAELEQKLALIAERRRELGT
jgi:MerR family transcriptional regulator, repressor of the yfmOP operon